MPVKLRPATEIDIPAIYALKRAVAEELTDRFGKGYWSSFGTEKSVAAELRSPTLWIAKQRGKLIAMLHLGARKPWAIDVAYFTPCDKPLYLTGMAVAPTAQGRGIGRECLIEAKRIAAGHPAGAIRLDAFDATAGAGPFYAKCGYREVGRVVYRKNPLIYYETVL